MPRWGTIELDLTVSLNLSCEEIKDTVTPIMAQTKPKLNICELSKGVKLKFLSIHVNIIKITINYLIICAIIGLNRY